MSAPAPAAASWARTLGAVVVALLALQAITGLALSAFYSPSVAAAWGSVAYVEDQVPGGWLVRALHVHGASALVVVTGGHLVHAAFAGDYRRPRQLWWWLGLALLLLVLAAAVTGYILRWDAPAYWAHRVEIGIAAGTPVIGGALRELALGGNDAGNLTLTRFHMLHVGLLPAALVAVLAARRALVTRHGRPAQAPNQALRAAVAIAAAFAALLAIAAVEGGAGLGAPADPTVPHDARPLWFFRWLFELRELAGSGAQLAALLAPAVVGGFLVALPLVDRDPRRTPRQRLGVLGALTGVLALVAGLTAMSLVRDASDPELAERRATATARADRARVLARRHGIPATGALDVFSTPPMHHARTLFAKLCASCHDAASADRLGPVIGPGYGDRSWLRGFLRAPSGPAYWGHTKLAASEEAMGPVDLPQDQLDDLVELLYAETGAADVDAPRRARGLALFEACTDCHTRAEGESGSAPALARLHDRAWFISMIGNPKSALHLGARSEMPRFDADLSLADRDALAGYLVWLRTATPADLAALEPL